MLLHVFLESLFFFLPAAIANMTPVLVAHWNIAEHLNVPVDMGYTYKGQPLFGDHKTVRGFIFGTLAAVIIALLQYFFVVIVDGNGTFFKEFNYTQPGSTLLLGFLVGLGALSGDALKSFFKRRLHITPGSTWFPFDQIDYIAGAILFSLPLVKPSIAFLGVSVITFFILHILFTTIGFFMGFKKAIL